MMTAESTLVEVFDYMERAPETRERSEELDRTEGDRTLSLAERTETVYRPRYGMGDFWGVLRKVAQHALHRVPHIASDVSSDSTVVNSYDSAEKAMTMMVKSWNSSSSSFDVIEHVESFTLDGNGRSANNPAHDLAGNMTFDGTQKLSFDGWNRLVSVAHAYRDGAGTLQSGQVHVTMSYDGKGRRIKKAISNSGE